MRTSFRRVHLLNALQTVAGVVPTRTPKPILHNVKVTAASGDTAVIYATDMEVSISLPVVAEVGLAGSFLLPALRTLAVLREMTCDEVTIEVNEKLHIIGEQSRYAFGVEDPQDYPEIVSAEFDYSISMGAQVLTKAIRRASIACDTTSTRYALGGALFQPDAMTSINVVATDTRRMAVYPVQAILPHDADQSYQTVVPLKALQLIEKSFDDDDVTIYFSPTSVLLTDGEIEIRSRLVEGRFPMWQQVIPQSRERRATLKAGDLYSAVRQSQIVTSDDSRGVDFIFSDDGLTLQARAADIGEAKIQTPIQYDDGENGKMTVTLDPRFLSDCLRLLDADENVHIDMTDDESAVVLRTDADGFQYVVMPLARNA